MAHAAPPPPSRRRNLRVAGAVLVVLGVVLLAVTIVSLTRPRQREAGRTAQSVSASTPPASAAARTTAASSTAAGSTAASSPATHRTTTARPAPTPTPTRTPTPAPTAAKVPIIVANNTNQADLAQTAASRFEAAGWQVSDLQNFDGGILSTCAYYDPSNPANLAAAQELQRQFPAIKRVKQRFDGLPSAPIVVVLTTDYS